MKIHVVSPFRHVGLYLPIVTKVASIAREQTHDCPSANEVALTHMGKIDP